MLERVDAVCIEQFLVGIIYLDIDKAVLAGLCLTRRSEGVSDIWIPI